MCLQSARGPRYSGLALRLRTRSIVAVENRTFWFSPIFHGIVPSVHLIKPIIQRIMLGFHTVADTDSSPGTATRHCERCRISAKRYIPNHSRALKIRSSGRRRTLFLGSRARYCVTKIRAKGTVNISMLRCCFVRCSEDVVGRCFVSFLVRDSWRSSLEIRRSLRHQTT